MNTEVGAPLLPSAVNWWKTAFDSDLYQALIPFERGETALEAELRLLPVWLDLQPGQLVLDVACGDGRLAIPLAKAGFHVVGLDQSTRMMNLAKRRVADAQVRVDLLQADMREFRLTKQVDAALCVFVSFGMFADEGDHLRMLTAIAGNLKPGGRLYLEVTNPYAFVTPRSNTESMGDGMLVYQTMLDHWTSRLNTGMHFARPGKPTQSLSLSWRAFTLYEIIRLLDAAGFDLKQANGGIFDPDDFFPVKSKTLGIIAVRRSDEG